jgi:hypothetical protein
MASTAQDEDNQIMLGLSQSVERDAGQSQRRLAAGLGAAPWSRQRLSQAVHQERSGQGQRGAGAALRLLPDAPWFCRDIAAAGRLSRRAALLDECAIAVA